MQPRTITDPDAARRFARAGRAVLTLSSTRTGARYTYRFARNKHRADEWYVSLLTGPDNENNYTYLGLHRADAPLRLTRASKLTADTPPVRAIAYFAQRVLRDGVMPPELEVRHEGRCGRCGRTLTVPESIDRGIGPECWGAMVLG